MLLNLLSFAQNPHPPLPAPPPPFFADMPLLLSLALPVVPAAPQLLQPNGARVLITGRSSGVVTPDFIIIEPGEADVFTFDITKDVEDGETVASVSWDCMVAYTQVGFTPDSSPSDCIEGAANAGTITNPVTGKVRWFTNQMVSDMLEGNYYHLRATVSMAPTSRIIKRYSRVLCTGEAYPP